MLLLINGYIFRGVVVKIGDCKKKFDPCEHCGSTCTFADQNTGINRCWKCGRRVTFKYVKNITSK